MRWARPWTWPGGSWRSGPQSGCSKIAGRQARQETTGHKARGKAPEPPKEGPRDKDQYIFTDPESRIMKDGGSFEQCYNAQAAVEVTTMLVVGQNVCNAPNDKQQLVPALPAAGAGKGQP